MAVRRKFEQVAGALALIAAVLATPAVAGLVGSAIQSSHAADRASESPSDIDWPY